MSSTTSCSICLETLPESSGLLATPVISYCCINPVCNTCLADWTSQASPNLTCQLCHNTMALASDSVEHPAIQKLLTRRGQALKDHLQRFHASLTMALAHLQSRQDNWTANIEQLARQIAILSDHVTDAGLSSALTQQLNTFYQASAKDFSLKSSDLNTKLKSTAVRLEHLVTCLAKPVLPFTLMVIADDWISTTPNLSGNLENYHSRVWYRHPQAFIATQIKSDSHHWSLRTQVVLSQGRNPLPLSYVRVGRGNQYWSPRSCFLNWYGHLVVYNRTGNRDDDREDFGLEMVDLTASVGLNNSNNDNNVETKFKIYPAQTSLFLHSRVKAIDIIQIQTVAVIPSGYLVFALHRDSMLSEDLFHYTVKLVVICFNQTGQLCQQLWSQDIHSDGLVHIQVYGQRVFVFGHKLKVWTVNSTAALTYRGRWPILAGSTGDTRNYCYHSCRDNWLYFYHSDTNGVNRDRFYRFDAEMSLIGDQTNSVLTEITKEEVIDPLQLQGDRVINSLRDYYPMALPGLHLYHGRQHDPNGSCYKLAASDGSSIATGQIVPIPDYWGNIYSLAG